MANNNGYRTVSILKEICTFTQGGIVEGSERLKEVQMLRKGDWFSFAVWSSGLIKGQLQSSHCLIVRIVSNVL